MRQNYAETILDLSPELRPSINSAVLAVLQNMANPRTNRKDKRGVTIELEFTGVLDEDRSGNVMVSASIKTKLSKSNPISLSLYVNGIEDEDGNHMTRIVPKSEADGQMMFDEDGDFAETKAPVLLIGENDNVIDVEFSEKESNEYDSSDEVEEDFPVEVDEPEYELEETEEPTTIWDDIENPNDDEGYLF